MESAAPVLPGGEPSRADRLTFPILLASLILLSLFHVYYISASTAVPSADEAHYMTGVQSVADGLRTGTIRGAWTGFKNALVSKAPLVCVLPAFLSLMTGSIEFASLLALVVTFLVLGLAAYSIFCHCLPPTRAAVAAFLLATMPMITGLTHRMYVETLLLLLGLVYLDVILRFRWRGFGSAALTGAVLGLGILCKSSFAPLLFVPSLYLLAVECRRLWPSADRWKQFGWLAARQALMAFVAFAIAFPWYRHNWRRVMELSTIAFETTACAYPTVYFFFASISSGPFLFTSLLAMAGVVPLVRSLTARKETDGARDAWIALGLLAAVTYMMSLISNNKVLRLTVTCLPLVAALAAFAPHAWGWTEKRARAAMIGSVALSALLFLHNCFAILPVPPLRVMDLRIVDSRFPLNVPHWFDDNHPVERRVFRLAEVEAFVEKDAAAHYPPGYVALARLTTSTLLISHDYYQFLVKSRGHTVHYLWWHGTVLEPPHGPEYVLHFRNFGAVYPGAHVYESQPRFHEDVAAGKVGYELIEAFDGPGDARIEVYRRK